MHNAPTETIAGRTKHNRIRSSELRDALVWPGARGTTVAPRSSVVAVVSAAAFALGQRAELEKRAHTERDVMNWIARMRALVRDNSGQDLLEYALLVALIALVCVAVITSTGSGVKTIFTNISSELSKAATP